MFFALGRRFLRAPDVLSRGMLNCRHDWGDLITFALLSMTGFLPAGLGRYAAGYGWWLAGGGFALCFFNVWETMILCSHCPFYARKGKTLACLANHGCIKLWKYNPAPMSCFEKRSVFICSFSIGGVAFACSCCWRTVGYADVNRGRDECLHY